MRVGELGEQGAQIADGACLGGLYGTLLEFGQSKAAAGVVFAEVIGRLLTFVVSDPHIIGFSGVCHDRTGTNRVPNVESIDGTEELCR